MRLKTKFLLALATASLMQITAQAQITIAPVTSPTLAEYVSMTWDASPDSTVIGYNLYYGTNSGTYAGKLDVGNTITTTLDIQPRGLTYYFAVTAYNATGEESPFSNELTYQVPNLIPQSPLLIQPVGPLAYGSTTPISTTGGSGSGAITYSVLSGPALLSADSSSVIITGIGTIVLTATKAADDVYLAASATNSISVTPATQSVSFAAIPSVKETNVVSLSATASSGLPVTFSVESGPGVVSGSQLSFSGPGTVTVVASQAGSSLYYGSSASQTITVAAVVWPSINPSASMVPLAGTYGSANLAFGSLDLRNGGEIGVSYSNSISYGPNAKGWLQVTPPVGNISAYSTVTLTASADVSSLAAGTYYATNTITSATATNAPVKWVVQLTVAPATQSAIAFNPATSQACGTTNLLSATGGSGTGSFSYSVVSGPGLIVGNGTQLLLTAGTGQVVVQATKSADTNYLSANVTATVTAAKGTQTVTFPSIPNQKTTNAVVLAASSTSKLPITYSIASGPGVISGNLLSFTGTGKVQVVAAQPGNSDYYAATSVTNSINVSTYLQAPGGFRIVSK